MDEEAIGKALDLAEVIEKDLKRGKDSFVAAAFNDAREKAIDATRRLIDVNPENPGEIRALQNEIDRLRQYAAWVRSSLSIGREAYRALPVQTRQELVELLGLKEINDA